MTSYFDDIKPLQDAIKKLPRVQRVFLLKWLLDEIVIRDDTGPSPT
jgi:hypothetical protein